MGRYRRWVKPLLLDADREARANKDARKQLHISLALLPVDSVRLEYLYGRLLTAEPQEILVIRQALQHHRQDLTERLWILVEDRKDQEEERFRAACALASFAPDDPRWENAGGDVAATLVIQKPFAIPRWTAALKPVARWLIPSLADFLVDEERTAAERGVIASVYGTYADFVPDAFPQVRKAIGPSEVSPMIRQKPGLPWQNDRPASVWP